MDAAPVSESETRIEHSKEKKKNGQFFDRFFAVQYSFCLRSRVLRMCQMPTRTPVGSPWRRRPAFRPIRCDS